MSGGADKLSIARQEIEQQLATIAERFASHHYEQASSTFPIPDIKILHAARASFIYSDALSKEKSKDNEAEMAGEEGYRCKCAFQLVSNSSPSDDLIYSVREQGEIISLKNGIFPQANRRIRRAMDDLMRCLNQRSTDEHSRYEFDRIRNNLTSVTFVSSWGDGSHDEDSLQPSSEPMHEVLSGDCHVTLHYGPPGLVSSSKDNILAASTENQYSELNWRKESQRICDQCNISSVTGRSKGMKFVVINSKSVRDGTSTDQCVIHDDLWITMQQNGSMRKVSSISLVRPSHDSSLSSVKIQYRKSSEAFQHPNARVMLTSLHWILNTLSKIVQDSNQTASQHKPRMLEMYCGCGAHTIPIAKSSFLSEIVAIELDQRLVDACRNNCILNKCLRNENRKSTNNNEDTTSVSVVKGDAAAWAKKILMSNHKRSRNNSQIDSRYNFDILLIDPPREGLDESVCELALKCHFQHVVYISCGRRALLRDLDILCMGGFEVADLGIIDLFPGTDAVESLVHLRRQSFSNST
jgi:tRNA/tmRNA/rRNA uracil-C5-methylase (TrmA/RlmC/RlmD family)